MPWPQRILGNLRCSLPSGAGVPLLLAASLALVQILHGVLKSGFKDPAHPSKHDPPFHILAPLEFAKFALASVLVFREGVRAAEDQKISAEERIPLNSSFDSDSDSREEVELVLVDKPVLVQLPTRRIYLAIAPVAVLSLLHHQLLHLLAPYANQVAQDSIAPFTILWVGLHSRLLLGTTVPWRSWTSAFLQITSIALIYHTIKLPSYGAAAYAILFLSAALSSLIQVTLYFVYSKLRDVPFHKINSVLFSSCFVAYALAAVVSPSTTRFFPPRAPLADILAMISDIPLRVIEDVLGLAVLLHCGPFALAALTVFTTSLVTPLAHIIFNAPTSFSNVQWFASALALYAGVSYLDNSGSTGDDKRLSTAVRSLSRRRVILICTSLVPLLAILATHPLISLPHATETFKWNSEEVDDLMFLPHRYDPAYNLTRGLNASAVAEVNRHCVRRPLPMSSAYVGPGERPDFHAFDDVLLVVFFSHPRYDINLDGYREVYSQYFPNILFIGPASREDRGFSHSYDVVLDSYMSEEDFTGWPKMAGRMAHHMFYTAVKDYPCYAGYLWAPFDALLNVPRLMQFPQDRIWYHSPFAEQFVPNPARDAELQIWEKRPPAAQTSDAFKTKFGRYEKNAGGWGARWEWWWGEQHVGLGACLRYYLWHPPHFRQRLENLTGSSLQLIGGSSDTVYIPGHLRADFLDTLGTFLVTECFLEIAVPTTVHMIVPPNEGIVWVDHWWKSPPPWNTTYVRDLWAEGYEADSFHTFHWGDIQDNGFFGPNKNSVADMRELLEDSFKRQGITPP